MSAFWIGVLGYPLLHSLSQKIHEENIKRYNLPWKFRVLEWDSHSFENNILETKKDPLCIGFSVTMPYKEKIISYLDECDNFSQEVSSVNCVKNNKGKWFGWNTDAPGFLYHFQKWNPPPPKNVHVVFLGVGSSARALSFILANFGYKQFTFINRSCDKAEQWINRFQKLYPEISVFFKEWGSGLPYYQDVFILNATPLGIKSESFDWLEIPKIQAPAWIFDITYNPAETLLIRKSRSRCFYTMNGWPLFQKQAELAFDIWRS